MARILTAATIAKLAEQYALKPVTIVEITWARGGTPRQYSDKPLTGIPGAILEVSGLDNTIVIQGGVEAGTSGDSQQIMVKLDDTSGEIKGIMDTTNVHKAPAKVYQYFEGTDLALDKVLLFTGEVSSPIQWNEGDRTLTCDILSKVEDNEVGFSIEEGFFRQENANVGDAWPMGFGTVVDEPALHIPSPRVGRLKTGFGIADHVLKAKLEQLANICCPYVFKGWRTQSVPTFSNGFPTGSRQQKIPSWGRSVECECKKRALTCQYTNNYNAQVAYQYSSLEIENGKLFPQDIYFGLYIEGAKIVGYFNGTDENPSDTFIANTWVHPARLQVNPINAPEIRVFRQDCSESEFLTRTLPQIYAEEAGIDTNDSEITCTITSDGTNCTTETLSPGGEYDRTNGASIKESFDYMANFKEAGFSWMQPGVQVNIYGDQEGVHIVNLIPSTVHTVKAYRTFPDTNFRQLATVPAEYYTVRNSDYNGYTVTEIVTPSRLSLYGNGWEDELYVSYTSTVGPNMVDIMTWLVDTYGPEYTMDGTFAALQSFFNAYPMHFVMPTRKNLLDVLRELAFQNRCAITLRDNVLSLTYLSAEPGSVVDTVSEDHVLIDTLRVGYTDTESLVTKFVANWRPNGADPKPFKVTLQLNTDLYGVKEEEFEFYAFKHRDLVLKSATFWAYRMANSWKKVDMVVPINLLELESLDYINITLPDVADGTVKAMVKTAVLETGSNTISLSAWVPVKAGSMVVSPTAWPGSMAAGSSIFETDDIPHVGAQTLNAAITAPEGHPLAVQWTAQEQSQPAGGGIVNNLPSITIGFSDWSSGECGEGSLHASSYFLCGYDGTDDEQASDWENNVDDNTTADDIPLKQQQPQADLEQIGDIDATEFVQDGTTAQQTNDNTETGYQQSGGRDGSVGSPNYETGFDSEGNETEFGAGEAADMDIGDYEVPAPSEAELISDCTSQDAANAGYVTEQSEEDYDAAKSAYEDTLLDRWGGFYSVQVKMWEGTASAAHATTGASKDSSHAPNPNPNCTGGFPENIKYICGVRQCFDSECCDSLGANCIQSESCTGTAASTSGYACPICANMKPEDGCTYIYTSNTITEGSTMYFNNALAARKYARQAYFKSWGRCGGVGTGSRIATVNYAHEQEGGNDYIIDPENGVVKEQHTYDGNYKGGSGCTYGGSSGSLGVTGMLPSRSSQSNNVVNSNSPQTVTDTPGTMPWGDPSTTTTYGGDEATGTNVPGGYNTALDSAPLEGTSPYDRTDIEGNGQAFGLDAMTASQQADYDAYLGQGPYDNLFSLPGGATIPSCKDCMCAQNDGTNGPTGMNIGTSSPAYNAMTGNAGVHAAITY